MAQELPSPSLFKEEAQQLRKGERLGQNTLSLPLFNADGKSMLTGIRGDTPGLTGHALIDEMSPGQKGRYLGMAHHYRTPGTRIRAHPHAGDSPLPQAGPQNNLTTEPSSREGPTGLLGRSDGLGKMMNERPLKDKHLCLLTLRVNFITETPTPATAGAQTSLGGYRECRLV